MRPYGLVPDGHQYLLNDNDKRDAVFAKWARSRERMSAKKAIASELEAIALACQDCGGPPRGCSCAYDEEQRDLEHDLAS